MGKRNNPGCHCCCNGTVRVRVGGCSIFLGGVPVAIKQGSTVLGSGTTDSGGYYPALAAAALAITAAGSYTADVSASGRYAASSNPMTLGCVANVIPITSTPLAAYFCCNNSGTTKCEPIPNTLHLTDPNGTINIVHCGQQWTGCYPLTRAGVNEIGYDLCAADPAVVGAVGYVLYCPNTSPYFNTGFVLEQQWGVCFGYAGRGMTSAQAFTSATCRTPGDCSTGFAVDVVGLGLKKLIAAEFATYLPTSPCIPLAQTFTMPATALVPGTVSIVE